jgi:hypothetical protein
MKNVLVIVTADPHRSGRALEGLRTAVGLTLARNRVCVLLAGPAAALLDPEGEGFPRHRRAREYLDALAGQGAEVGAGEEPRDAVRRADAVVRWDE